MIVAAMRREQLAWPVFASVWRMSSMTYDWSGRRMRRVRAAKLTIISIVAAFVLTAPLFAQY